MGLKLTFTLFFILIFSKLSYSQSDEIRFFVAATDELNGNTIGDCEILVNEAETGFKIPKTTEKKESFYKITKGKKIKITAIAKGYYKEQQYFDTDDLIEDQNILIKLIKSKGKVLKIKLIDALSKKNIEGILEIKSSSPDFKQNFNERIDWVNFYFNVSEKAQLTASAMGYTTKNEEIVLDANTDPKDLILELSKSIVSQVITVIDKLNYKPIDNVSYKIKDLSTQRIVSSGNTNDGKMQFEGEDSREYEVSFASLGFNPGKEKIKFDSKVIKNLYLYKTPEIYIISKESVSNNVINTEIEILDGENKKVNFEKKSNNTIGFTPLTIGKYTIVSFLNGFETEKKTINVPNLLDNQEIVSFLMKPKTENYVIKVFDFETKKPVDAFEIKVYDDKSKEKIGKKVDNEYRLDLALNAKHFYEITAKEYGQFTGNIEIVKETDIYLKKNFVKPNIFEFEIYDDLNQKYPTLSSFKLFDDQNNLLKTSIKGNHFILEGYPENKILFFEIMSDGYYARKGKISKPESLNIINIDKVRLQNFTVMVLDSLTNEEIEKKIFVKNGDKSVFVDDQNRFDLDEIENSYTIKIELQNYTTIANALVKENAKNNVFIYKVIKDFYPVEIVFSPTLSESQRARTETKVNNMNNGNAIKISENKFNFNLKDKYGLNTSIAGFEKTKNEINWNDIKNFTYTVVLKAVNEPNKINPILKEVKPQATKIALAAIPKQKLIIEPVKKMVEEPEEVIQPKIVAKVDTVIERKPIVEIAKIETKKPEEKKVIEKPIAAAKIENIKLADIEKPKPIKKDSETIADNNLPGQLTDIHKDVSYKLNGVNFEKSKALLIKGSEAQLDILAAFLKTNKKLKVEIIGHTDNEGIDQRLNKTLSLFRAKLVSNYLFNHGIDEKRITTIGMGSEKPIAPNDSEENKAKNRRVEVRVFEN